MIPSSSISIAPELPNCEKFGVYFVCGTCLSSTLLMIDRVAAGIALSDWDANLPTLKFARCKVCVVATPEGKLLISCGFCRSGRTALEISPARVGTYSLRESFKGENEGRLLRERLEFFK
jgi:hypothetical protein